LPLSLVLHLLAMMAAMVNLAASVIYTTAAPSVAMINRAAVVNFDGAVSVAFPTTVGDREAGASSH
jgi:hypothetical protein